MNWLNAACELVAAGLAWRSVWEALETAPRGVYWPQMAFSALWAIECIPYYLGHGDAWSALFAVWRCAGCLVWTWLAVRA